MKRFIAKDFFRSIDKMLLLVFIHPSSPPNTDTIHTSALRVITLLPYSTSALRVTTIQHFSTLGYYHTALQESRAQAGPAHGPGD